MSVGKICLRDVLTADREESVRAAGRRMKEHRVGTLVVLDEAQRPIGLVTDRDLALRVVAEGRDADTTTVGTVMTGRPKTIAEGVSIESALAQMTSGSLRRLPVVDEGGKLVGVVSLDDVLALLAEEFALIGRLLERETPTFAAD